MMNRRDALARMSSLMGLGILGAAKCAADPALAADVLTSGVATETLSASEPFTIAHITDVHITPELNSEKWFAQCLHKIQSHPSRPRFILNSGDAVYETLKEDKAKADALWALWNGVIKRENSLPIHHILGNHDIWGWAIQDNPAFARNHKFQKSRQAAGGGP